MSSYPASRGSSYGASRAALPRVFAGDVISPTSLDGLRQWLKADSGDLLQASGGAAADADNDPVGQYTDQSGNGNHATQSTTAAKPTFKTGIINGLPVVRSDGSDDFMIANALASIKSGADQPVTVFAVADVGTTTNRILWAWNHSTDANPLVEQWWNGSNWIAHQERDDAGALRNDSVAGSSAGSAITYTVVDSGTSVEHREDGTSVGSVARDVGTTTVDLFTLFGGRRAGSLGQLIAADLGELLIYNRQLAQAEVDQVEAYLRDRWGTW